MRVTAGGGFRRIPSRGSSSSPMRMISPGWMPSLSARTGSVTKPSPARQRAQASRGSEMGVPKNGKPSSTARACTRLTFRFPAVRAMVVKAVSRCFMAGSLLRIASAFSVMGFFDWM